jgi:tetratricopeptide (TPR) repeat protein
MSESLYERYKDALRRGHVAAMHGRTEVALAAYVEAATIAPDRALPHASIGSVYLRAGRHRDALPAFDAALARSADDEAALGGRAAALEALGRPADAASTLDELAAVQDAAGRLADACDTARRALALAESRPRRRAVEGLVARLREADASDAGAAALERAVRVLEATAPADRAPDHDEGRAAGDGAEASPPLPPVPPVPSLGESIALTDLADAAVARGDATEARRLLLEAAAGHARAGRPDAALDACATAVALGPADPDAHLALAELYLERGWRGLAGEKLDLLGRLAELTADDDTRERIRAIAGPARREPADLGSGLPSAG